MSNQSLAKRGQVMPAEHGAADVAAVTNRVALIQQVYKNIMQPDVHYGVIPGTPKPSLWKPGAEVVLMALNAAATFPAERVFRVLDKAFVMYEITAAIKSNGSQEIIAEGIGLCSSREDKYAYRKGAVVCPECGQAAIIKGQEQYGGGWLCYKKKGGCGKKWTAPDAFDPKQAEKQPNPNIWEQANTILKMAEKRALVAAVLNLGASDIFTQDIEDFVEVPNQAGWNGSGSKEAAQAVAQEKLREYADTRTVDQVLAHTPPVGDGPMPDIAEDPLPPSDAPTGQQAPRNMSTVVDLGTESEVDERAKRIVGARPAADPRLGKYLYGSQAADMKEFTRLKRSVGEEAYRRCLAYHDAPKSNYFTTHAAAGRAINDLLEIEKAQAKQRKLKSEQAKAEMDAASLLPSREGSGCPIPIANQIATCIKKLGTPWEEANAAMQAQLDRMRKDFPDGEPSEQWTVILLGLQDVIARRDKEGK